MFEILTPVAVVGSSCNRSTGPVVGSVGFVSKFSDIVVHEDCVYSAGNIVFFKFPKDKNYRLESKTIVAALPLITQEMKRKALNDKFQAFFTKVADQGDSGALKEVRKNICEVSDVVVLSPLFGHNLPDINDPDILKAWIRAALGSSLFSDVIEMYDREEFKNSLGLPGNGMPMTIKRACANQENLTELIDGLSSSPQNVSILIEAIQKIRSQLLRSKSNKMKIRFLESMSEGSIGLSKGGPSQKAMLRHTVKPFVKAMFCFDDLNSLKDICTANGRLWQSEIRPFTRNLQVLRERLEALIPAT